MTSLRRTRRALRGKQPRRSWPRCRGGRIQTGGEYGMAMLGGRAAELVVYDHLSTGAANDLERVTDTARAMVTRYGMSEKLGSVAYERDPRSLLAGPNRLPGPRTRDYGEAAADAIDAEVRSIVDGVLERTVALLRERRDALDRGARRLLEKETLDGTELIQLAGRPVEPVARRVQ